MGIEIDEELKFFFFSLISGVIGVLLIMPFIFYPIPQTLWLMFIGEGVLVISVLFLIIAVAVEYRRTKSLRKAIGFD